MRKLVITLVFGIMITQAHANIYCTGMDGTGKTIKVIVNEKTDEIIINNDVHKLNGGVVDNKNYNFDAMRTENFITYRDINSYVVFGIFTKGSSKNKWFLVQYNTFTNKPMAYVNLSCNVSSEF